MGGATIGLRIIKVFTWIFLARLLEPSDFGAVALATILISTAKLFSGLGMGNAVIHSKLDRAKMAFHAFAVTAMTGSILFLLVYTNANLFAGILGDPNISDMLRWMSIIILLDTVSLVPEGLLKKDLLFGRVSGALILTDLLHAAVALSLAYIGFGAWSLIFANLTRASFNVVFLWILTPGWDWIVLKRWNQGIVKSLLQFGVMSSASGLVSFFNHNWDDWLVGRMIGSTALGFYNRAYVFTNQTLTGFNGVIGSVLFPSYAKIQDDKARLSRAYLKSLRLFSLLTVPLAMGTTIITPEIVPVLLGDKWIPMVTVMQIMAMLGMIRSLSGTTSSLFSAVGRPGYNFRTGVIQAVLIVVVALLLLDRGIAGVAFAVTFAYTIGYGYNIYQIHKILPDTALKVLPASFPAIAASILMMGVVQISKTPLQQWAGGQHTLLTLILLILIGATVYGVTLLLTQRSLIEEIIQLLISTLGLNSKSIFARKLAVRK